MQSLGGVPGHGTHTRRKCDEGITDGRIGDLSHAAKVFEACVKAIVGNIEITRQGSRDKEFHFQDWFECQLKKCDPSFDSPGRNSYPDFRMVHTPVGYELKGLAYPGREGNYDCNSQVPRGTHHGRTVYYVFGRYPAVPDGPSYPVMDLVICHGSFLNANENYIHKNRSFRGFGSYGDILVRDRKMYVAPTPYALAKGTAHRRTLIVPATEEVPASLKEVGTLMRREVNEVVGSYSFDLETNVLGTMKIPNPHAGKEHVFKAYRLAGDPMDPVTLVAKEEVLKALDDADQDLEAEEKSS